jgi:hypothetical protein
MKKQPVGVNPKKGPEPPVRFFIDFSFMRASGSNYRSPCLGSDHVLEYFEGLSSYLIVVDKASY